MRHDPVGSSPLTRGKHEESGRGGPEAGLIPAHAGKTHGAPPCSSSCRAHPRSRGENQAAAIEEQKGKGSSPLTRGKLLLVRRGGGHGRLIPAHAGKT